LRAKAKILFRIQKIERDGHFGDYKPLGDGILELKIDFAKGYRIYYTEKKEKLFFYLLVEKKWKLQNLI
jgi:putative addiction module killer protein